MAYQVHQIKGGNSRARKNGKNHTGNRKPTQKQLGFLFDLRRETGSPKTFIPDTRMEAADEIELLLRRKQLQRSRRDSTAPQ